MTNLETFIYTGYFRRLPKLSQVKALKHLTNSAKQLYNRGKGKNKVANTVTIKISPRTKTMMDIFAAKHGFVEDSTLTHDDVISELVKLADPDTFKQVEQLEEKKKKGKDKE